MSEIAYNCAACDKPIDDDQAYGSIGGKIIPFIPAKIYHIRCIPVLKSEPNRLKLAEEKLAQQGIEWDGEKYAFNGKD